MGVFAVASRTPSARLAGLRAWHTTNSELRTSLGSRPAPKHLSQATSSYLMYL